MPTSYAQNKEHIYKWRENNRNRFNELSAKNMKKYRLKQKIWKEIKVEFLAILI